MATALSLNTTQDSPGYQPGPVRDELWERCRNSLGIARLLVQERRPQALVITSCALAAELACRAALEQAGLDFNGDLGRGLARLGAPEGLYGAGHAGSGAEYLAAAEQAVAWVAGRLRREAPERPWGY